MIREDPEARNVVLGFHSGKSKSRYSVPAQLQEVYFRIEGVSNNIVLRV